MSKNPVPREVTAPAYYDSTGDDGDESYRTTCPRCHVDLHLSPSRLGSVKCSCGYVWEITVEATGRLPE